MSEPNQDEVLRFVFKEAKDHFEAAAEAVADTSSRAESVVRFNVLVIGLLVTAVSLLVRSGSPLGGIPGPVVVVVGLGFVSLVASTTFAVTSYLKRGVAVGLDMRDLVTVTDSPGSMEDLLPEVVESYARGVLRNEEIALVAGRRFAHALRFLLAGIILLAAGAVGLMVFGVT